MKVDENIKRAKVQDININGEGVFYVEGEKSSIKGVLAGEEIQVKVLGHKKNYCECVLDKVLKPSKDRITPLCPYADRCGGCDFMHVDQSVALNIKKNIISSYFSKYFSDQIVENSSKSIFHYRNKVSFIVKGDKIGLYAYKTNRFVQIDNCLVADERINSVLAITSTYLKQIKNNTIHHLVVRVVGEDVSVVLVATSHPQNAQDYASMLEKQFLGRYSLYVNINKDFRKILSDNYKFIAGKEMLSFEEFGITYFVHPHAFLQINDDVRKKLYSRVQKEITNKNVIEGYSGVGILSAIMSKTAKSVVSIEINKSAYLSAEQLKKYNRINNLTNINGDFGEFLTKVVKSDSILVIDPPRSGCSKECLDSILQALPEKIVYISCNPYTLKQNLGYIKEFYFVSAMEIFDMFPQTSDIETFVVLQKK